MSQHVRRGLKSSLARFLSRKDKHTSFQLLRLNSSGDTIRLWWTISFATRRHLTSFYFRLQLLVQKSSDHIQRVNSITSPWYFGMTWCHNNYSWSKLNQIMASSSSNGPTTTMNLVSSTLKSAYAAWSGNGQKKVRKSCSSSCKKQSDQTMTSNSSIWQTDRQKAFQMRNKNRKLIQHKMVGKDSLNRIGVSSAQNW